MSEYLFFTLVLFALAVVFASTVNSWCAAIARGQLSLAPVSQDPPPVSVIIPARNEEAGIALVLQDLFAQSYPTDRMEVIVVDDDSNDATTRLVRDMIPRWPQLRLMNSTAHGKKAAITAGVAAATGELIILTDADVRCGPERIASIVSHWSSSRNDMVVLPVSTNGDALLGGLQNAEQDALLGMAMGSAKEGAPTLAYGANLAFTREAFLTVGGYEGDVFASGDDLFLLKRFMASGRSVGCLFDPKVLVIATAASSPAAFVQQRLRWAGKMRGAGALTMLIGFVALAFPWVLLMHTLRFEFTARMGEHAVFTLAILAGAWACWSLPLVSLTTSVRRKLDRPANHIGAFISLLAFSIYAPLIALVSLVVRPRWKGRRI